MECMKTIEGGTQRSSLPSEEKQISLIVLLSNRRSKQSKTVVVAAVCLSFIYGHQTCIAYTLNMFHILNGIREVLDLHLSGQAYTSTHETIKVSSASSTPQVVSERNHAVIF